MHTITSLQRPFTIDNLVMVYYFEYTADFSFPGESHDFWEIVYVESGNVEAGADNKRYVLEKGQMVFHAPNEFHTLRAVKKSCPNLVIISFASRSSAFEYLYGNVLTLDAFEKAMVHRLVDEARVAFSTPLYIPCDSPQLCRASDSPFGAEQMIATLLEQLMVSLVRRRMKTTTLPSADMAYFSVPETENEYVNQVLKYLSQHLCCRLDVHQICTENHLGRSRLQQLFHSEFGCGVQEYFCRMKANAAKNLLRSGVSVSQVSEQLGYSSPAYFSSFFKKMFGKSPQQYRYAILDTTRQASLLPQNAAEAERNDPFSAAVGSA